MLVMGITRCILVSDLHCLHLLVSSFSLFGKGTSKQFPGALDDHSYNSWPAVCGLVTYCSAAWNLVVLVTTSATPLVLKGPSCAGDLCILLFELFCSCCLNYFFDLSISF